MARADRSALTAELDAILHCAASISFSLPLEEARAINVEGTREILALAREAPGLRRFLHVSTAYVAGLRGGRFRERQLDTGQRFRNTYEQTKWEAEHLVADAVDLAPCIARPSIVVGESDSGWTPAFNVLYWPLRAFSRGLFDQVPARLEAHIDVVPVDYVADGIVHLLGRDDAGVVSLVSGERAPRAHELIDLACGRFGRERPLVVEPGNSAGASADEHGAVYLPYFDMDVIFDDLRARSLLAPAGIRPPLLTDYFATLMDYAERARWGKRGVSREEARGDLEVLAA
jgi:long-chain acyl-CoA synthetase